MISKKYLLIVLSILFIIAAGVFATFQFFINDDSPVPYSIGPTTPPYVTPPTTPPPTN